ncbi:MAG: cytochrome b N-terminal domain-containing protein [Bdellovibrionales bacterium]|nr:cytochrome b N-terminal domain-containing protein [Bdellovibrionales bacterium]
MNDKDQTPITIKILQRLTFNLDKTFNKIFGSKYNPLYSSGSIAFFLILIMIVTGIYLLFFYRVGAPYESMSSIQNDVIFGRFIRGIHRYSSNLAVVAVIVHILRMIVQNKYFGPRILAWVSGALLLIVLYVTAWTGYILVWDQFAQVLAQSGAKIFDDLGVFIDPISRAFSGELDKPPSSFFFMNLFLHTVLPLLMIFMLWIHTSKIARARWLPDKKFKIGLFACLAIATIVYPLNINDKANLLKVVNSFTGDSYYALWVLLKDNSQLIIVLHLILFIALITIPWWLKPKRKIAVASNNPNACEGCGQCVEDCPYEAIQMFPRKDPQKGQSFTVAQVDSSLCIGCGICSGSCKPFTMGPEGKRAGSQLKMARGFLAELKLQNLNLSDQTLLVVCEHQKLNKKKILKSINKNIIVYTIECVGQLHMSVLEILARPFEKIIVASCSERNAVFKDSYKMIEERISGVREPNIYSKNIKNKIKLIKIEAGDLTELSRVFGIKKNTIKPWQPVTFGTVLILLLVAIGKPTYTYEENNNSILRLSWRLSGQNIEVCKDLSKDMQSSLKHMRLEQHCERTPVDYKLLVYINDEIHYEEIISPGGFRSDRPHYVYKNFKLTPGTYSIRVDFIPHNNVNGLKHLSFQKDSLKAKAEKIRLIYFDQKINKLVLK